MQTISVFGSGAFGTAIAMSLAASGRKTLLWGRDAEAVIAMQRDRENRKHLPGATFSSNLIATPDITLASKSDVILLAVPTQSLRAHVSEHREALKGHVLITCCKGIEQGTGFLPSEVINDVIPATRVGLLTGPSFASDIAVGKPTALTLALKDQADTQLQALLSTPNLRLYLTDDLVGAQLGGALKNVVAIAAGIVIGAGLGESARASLMTRAFAEMTGYAQARGARAETLYGLSGFGDLVLTCTSTQSRNFRHGFAFGSGEALQHGVTVEGVMTAHAIVQTETARDRNAYDKLPVTYMVSALLSQRITLEEAIHAILNRPMKRELSPLSGL